MNAHASTRVRISSVLFAAVLLVALPPLYGGAEDSKPVPPVSGQKAAPSTKTNKRSVYVGMPASDLMALIGKPHTIIPVPSKSPKDAPSEIWEYRQLLKTTTDVVNVGSKPITMRRPNADGSSSEVVISSEPITKLQQTDTFQVARFLITDGKFAASTQFEEKKQSFQ